MVCQLVCYRQRQKYTFPNLILFDLLAKGYGKSYIGILKPTVRCYSMIQAGSYGSTVPDHPIFFRDCVGHGPRHHATATLMSSELGYHGFRRYSHYIYYFSNVQHGLRHNPRHEPCWPSPTLTRPVTQPATRTLLTKSDTDTALVTIGPIDGASVLVSNTPLRLSAFTSPASVSGLESNHNDFNH